MFSPGFISLSNLRANSLLETFGPSIGTIKINNKRNKLVAIPATEPIKALYFRFVTRPSENKAHPENQTTKKYIKGSGIPVSVINEPGGNSSRYASASGKMAGKER